MTEPGHWRRNLNVLSAAQLATVSSMGIIMPLIPFFLRELGMSDRAAIERWSGLIFAGPFLAAAIVSPLWGHLGDRFGHKKMVVRAIVGLAVVNLALVFIESPAHFFLLRVFQGMVTGFVPAALALVSASTPRGELPWAMGRLAASASAGRLLGPALGGVLAGFLPFRQLFLLVGLIIGAAAVYVAAQLRETPSDATARSLSLGAPLRQVLKEWKLRIALPGLMLSMVGIAMTMPIFPLYVEDLCGAALDARLITGLGFAVVAAFTLLGSTLLGKISARVGLKPLLVGASTLAATSLFLHAHAHNLPAMFALRALLGLAIAGIGPALHAMIGRQAPEGMRGGITGLANSATILGFFVGPLLGGWLANQLGIDGVFRVAATVSIGCALAAAVVAQRTGRQSQLTPVPRETPR